MDINNNPLDSKYSGMYTIGNQESSAQFKVPTAFDQGGEMEGIWMSKYDASKVEITVEKTTEDATGESAQH